MKKVDITEEEGKRYKGMRLNRKVSICDCKMKTMKTNFDNSFYLSMKIFQNDQVNMMKSVAPGNYLLRPFNLQLSVDSFSQKE